MDLQVISSLMSKIKTRLRLISNIMISTMSQHVLFHICPSHVILQCHFEHNSIPGAPLAHAYPPLFLWGAPRSKVNRASRLHIRKRTALGERTCSDYILIDVLQRTTASRIFHVSYRAIGSLKFHLLKHFVQFCNWERFTFPFLVSAHTTNLGVHFPVL